MDLLWTEMVDSYFGSFPGIITILVVGQFSGTQKLSEKNL